MKISQNTIIESILKANFDRGFSETDQFNRISFRGWMYRQIEEGIIALPEGVNEYDVYEAADRY